MKLCINTQTPPLNFNVSNRVSTYPSSAFTGAIAMNSLKEGVDFEYNPGGVTRMILPLLAHMIDAGLVEGADWVCLNPDAPAIVRTDKLTIRHVNLVPERRTGYGLAKEILWRAFHGLSEPAKHDLLWADNFVDFTFYNRITSELIKKLDAATDFDLFYINDFQQLPIGHMLQTMKPKLLRWHIPFEESMVPPEWRSLLSTYLASYDAIVVSSRKYLDALKSWGYTGASFYVYPYIDEAVYTKPAQADLNELKTRVGVRGDDRVVVVVARLDPMKGQDTVIKAIPEVLRNVGRVKFVFVGDGSFSSSRRGLGLSKSEEWLTELRAVVKSLHVEDNVSFAGYLPQRLLNAAYDTCDAAILPSRREGFGLVVVESWLYKKPTLVSTKAGIAELIEDAKNGLLIDPANSTDVAEKISGVLTDQDLANQLGENGYITSRKCLIAEGLKAEWQVISNLV